MPAKSARYFVERSLSRFAEVLQASVFAEETARKDGWMQGLDARVKCAGLLLLLLASSLSRSLPVILVIYAFSLILAAGSHLFSGAFLRRAWIFMPLYSALIAFPALFLTAGDAVLTLPVIGWSITEQGLRAAAFLVARVATSVSLMLILVLTTPWPRLLKALRSLGFPRIFVLLLLMTHRYIYVLLNTAISLFQARNSRRVGPESWSTSRQWFGSLLGTLLQKSNLLGQEVYLAMLSRGFRGEPVLMDDFHLCPQDYIWAIVFVATGTTGLFFGLWSR